MNFNDLVCRKYKASGSDAATNRSCRAYSWWIHCRGMKMNSKNTTKRTLRAAIVALGGAVALTAMTGCYSPRATDTVTGAALGAGTGALIGSAEGSPRTGALIGGVGGRGGGHLGRPQRE